MVRIALFVALLLACSPGFAQSADRIWSGGTVLTMNDAAMRAEAIAERDGKIVAVGSKAEVMKLRGPDTRLIDLGGRALLPGFVDAHGHVVMGGLQALSANLLAPPDGDVTDIATLQQTLRDWLAANREAVRKVQLVVGFGQRRHDGPTRVMDALRRVRVVACHQVPIHDLGRERHERCQHP